MACNWYVPTPAACSSLPYRPVNDEQDSGLHDLARKFNVTLEAIALQTRHIVDQMNAKGHSIRSIYMSGGQAKNAPLMQLFANTCNMPVVLPQSSGAAVVLGAAMLGRFAGEAQGRPEKLAEDKRGEALWEIMVSGTQLCLRSRRMERRPSGTSCSVLGGRTRRRNDDVLIVRCRSR